MRVKRAFDLLVSACALVLASPLMIVIAVIVRRDGGPALYRGERVGLRGTTFSMLKFRTMVVGAERIGGTSTPDDDPRVTRIGRVLRRSKLDELPQLINVLKGGMSLVGPRPQVEHDVALYTEEEQQLLSVRPGITDYASIRFRNEGDLLRGSADPSEAYHRLIRPEKIGLGLEYVRTRSMALDLKIIGLTILAVFNQRAALRSIPSV